MQSIEFALMLKEWGAKFLQFKEMIMCSTTGCMIMKIFLLLHKENYSSFYLNFRFIQMKDGVHVLLKDRSEVGKFFVPSVPNSKVNADHLYGETSPSHIHHNWRFNDIYEKAKN
jgi:hypothetical protein